MGEWVEVGTLDGDGQSMRVRVSRCPECVALVEDQYRAGHDDWHQQQARAFAAVSS